MKPDIYEIGLRLRVGVLLLAPLAFFLHANGLLWGATPFVLLYFTVGLMAVSLIRAEQIERERSGFAASLTPRWVLTVFITSLLITGTAGLIAAILNGEAIAASFNIPTLLWDTFLAVVAIALSTLLFLLTPLFSLINLLVYALSNLFNFLFNNGEGILPPLALGNQNPLQSISDMLSGIEPSQGPTLPFFGVQIFVGTIMLGLVVLITFFLTRYIRQPTIASPPGKDSSDTSDMENVNQGLAERLFHRLEFIRRWQTANSIRRIYGNMCQAAAASGLPRGLAETPYEYLDTLYSVWPNNRQEISLITEAYVRVRYGRVPETEEELQEIKSAWQKVSVTPPLLTNQQKTE